MVIKLKYLWPFILIFSCKCATNKDRLNKAALVSLNDSAIKYFMLYQKYDSMPFLNKAIDYIDIVINHDSTNYLFLANAHNIYFSKGVLVRDLYCLNKIIDITSHKNNLIWHAYRGIVKDMIDTSYNNEDFQYIIESIENNGLNSDNVIPYLYSIKYKYGNDSAMVIRNRLLNEWPYLQGPMDDIVTDK